MTDSQNKKNEQQKDLRITSEQLTEQWVNIYKSKKYGDSYWTGTFGYRTKEDAIEDLADKENYLTTINIKEVLELQEENAQLKELLKKANKFLKDYGFTFDGKDCAEAFKVHTKINEVLK